MADMTIRAKLGFAFGGLAAMVLLVSGLSIKALGDADDRFDNYVSGINARTNMVHQVREAIDLRAIAVRNLVLVTKAEDFATEKDVVVQAHRDVGEKLTQLKKLAEDKSTSDEARRLISEMDTTEQRYAPVALKIVDLALNKKTQEAIAMMNSDCLPLLRSLDHLSTEFVTYNAGRTEKFLETAQRDFETQRMYLISGCLLALIAAVVAGIQITLSLTRALGGEPDELKAATNRVADGDFSTALQVRSGDTTSVMAAIDRMQSSLTRVVATVRLGSESVSTAAVEIAQGNQDLSGRTESQASALEQTAASMEQLSSQVQHNAENAQQANQLAMNASAVAVRGGEVVGRVVDTMKEINDSSRRISEIISVIDGIAFQTNILALNAAVEAARAGEQGRGFAVVASEVRSLAGRSADAAKEIKNLITASVEKVEIGTTLVDEAGATMTEVVGSIRRVSDLVGEISSATNEQAAGVAQIGEAVTQMDQVTQQNASLVEEMAAAASSLKSQSLELVQTVAVFKLDADHIAQKATSALPTSSPQFASTRLPSSAPKKGSTSGKPRLMANLTMPAFSPASPQLAVAGGPDDGWDSF